MPATPADLPPGTVLHHSRFYLDKATGEYKPKFLVLLAPMRGGDWVVRLLTSQHADVRPEHPPCHHGDPYPGFHLGVLDPVTVAPLPIALIREPLVMKYQSKKRESKFSCGKTAFRS